MILSKRLKDPFEVLHPRFERAARKASVDLINQGIEHVLTGGIAAGTYGRPRATKDIDFLVDIEARGKLVGASLGGGVKEIMTEYEGVPVDLLFSPRIPEAFTRVKGIPIVGPEDLVLMKLERSSYRDLNDIIEVIRGGNLSLDKLWKLAEEVGAEKEDIEQVIAEAFL